MKFHPIILVEGPDGGGKTTLCKQYRSQFGGKYIHLRLHKDMFRQQVAALHLAIKWSFTQPVLIDRHWPSELIYAAAYRGGSRLHEEAEAFSHVMKQLGVYLVLCLPGSEEDAINCHRMMSQQREELYEPSERFTQVVRHYYNWWNGSNWDNSPSYVMCNITPLKSNYPKRVYRYDRLAPNGTAIQAWTINNFARRYRHQQMSSAKAAELVFNREHLLHTLNYKL